ncbi:MAG: hypothetical protein WDN46_04905 [Methylocella sp.]
MSELLAIDPGVLRGSAVDQIRHSSRIGHRLFGHGRFLFFSRIDATITLDVMILCVCSAYQAAMSSVIEIRPS